jgi:(p)ppGpp synthase/HD superfamily hydrolase
MDSKIISFAIEAHAKTNHLYDGKPYSVHLAMVALNAVKFIDCIPKENQNDILSACWLHDTIEDCRLTYNDVKQVAGQTVADIVYAVTNEKGKNRKERANNSYYEGIRNIPFAKYVKLCDRLANVQYSYQNMSTMYEVYKKENDNFLNELFPNSFGFPTYKNIVTEIKKTLSYPNQDNKPQTKITPITTSFDKVHQANNQQLILLLKEIKQMSLLDAPKDFKKSEAMEELFELEKQDCYTWSDQYGIVKRAIENQILDRLKNDNWF